MSSLTLDALAQKYEALAEQDKKTVFDFIEFLSQKRKPKKEKLVDRIIRILFGGPSNDPDTENMMRGVINRMFLNMR